MNRRDILKAVPSVSLAGLAAVGATKLEAAPSIFERYAALSLEDKAVVTAEIERLEAARAETSVMQAYRQWEIYRRWLKGPEGASLSAQDFDKFVEHQSDLACDILGMPAETPADFIAKVIAYTYFGENALPDHDEMPGLWAEAKRLMEA